MKKGILWTLLLIGALIVLGFVWAFLAGNNGEPKPSGEKRVKSAEKDPCLERAGAAEKTYSLFFENSTGEGLTVEKMRFEGLGDPKAQVTVFLRYDGQRPIWPEKNSAFRVIQPGRSNTPQFSSIGAVKKISGEEAFRQQLSGLLVNPEDLGIRTPGEEPVNPLFLEMRGFIEKRAISVGILVPTDCPVGSIEEKLPQVVDTKGKEKSQKNKSQKKKSQKKKSQKGKQKSQKKQSQKKKSQKQ